MRVQRQRGVALLVALLVVALATLLIASLLDSGQLALARTSNLVRGEQASAYAHGLEAYAVKVLVDNKNDGRPDTNNDAWAVPLPPTPVPSGTISGTMRDMNGCFNLNNLGPSDTKLVWQERFKRLLQNLQLRPTIAAAVAKWVGGSSAPDERSIGDGVYLGRTPAYRAANRLFADVSELRLVMGVDAHTYSVLAPYVCVLPSATLLNINTASVPVLMSVSSEITQSVAERVYSDGHASWKDPVAAFQQAGVVLSQKDKTDLAVHSTYFMARGQIELDGIDFTYTSLIQRDPSVHVRWRRMGGDG